MDLSSLDSKKKKKSTEQGTNDVGRLESLGTKEIKNCP